MIEPSNRPAASFDPRLRPMLERGCRESFTVQCESPSQAFRLQMRLQQFRHRLKKDGAEGAERLYDCLVSLDRKNARVTLRPRKEEFGTILDDAVGKEPMPTLSHDPLDDME